MPKKLRNVVGNTATVLKKLLHTKKIIGDKYSNIGPQERLNDMVMDRKGTKPIKSNPTTVIFFLLWFPKRKNIYISERYCKVLNEGEEANLFDEYIPPPPQEGSKSE